MRGEGKRSWQARVRGSLDFEKTDARRRRGRRRLVKILWQISGSTLRAEPTTESGKTHPLGAIP
jgi:hypothetical protein